MNKSFTGRLLDWPIELPDGSEQILTIVYDYYPAVPRRDHLDPPEDDTIDVTDVLDKYGNTVTAEFIEDMEDLWTIPFQKRYPYFIEKAEQYVYENGSFEPDPDPRYDD
jgi:hypothetical protein